MNIEPYLAGYAFMQVERPLLLWEIEAEEEPFVRLVGEMIAVGLGRRNDLADLVLSAANVTVPPEAAGDRLPAGDYVGITFAYSRTMGEVGSVTVYFPRLSP
jgi:hypothetical protein